MAEEAQARYAMQGSRPGKHESWALRNTIHALQVCAATWDKTLIWNKDARRPPKRLIPFLVQALRAAKIKHPNPEESRSKFVKLMLRPRKPMEQQTEQPFGPFTIGARPFIEEFIFTPGVRWDGHRWVRTTSSSSATKQPSAPSEAERRLKRRSAKVFL